MAPQSARLGALAAVVCAASAYHAYEALPARMRGGALEARLRAEHAAEQAALARRFRHGHAHLASYWGPDWAWAPNVTANYKPSRIDNSNASSGTYQQRFYVDLSFCLPMGTCATSAPILAEIGGEWTVSSSAGGAVAELAASMNAVIVYLEHRFYGGSMPAPLTERGSMMSYLNVEQAIEDTAAFVPYFNNWLGSTSQRQWVIVGGSYAGALVTWITVAHGDLLAATWASSGVANAIFNFTAFDMAVATAIGPSCSAAVSAVTSAFEAAWSVNNTALFAMFGVPPGFLTQADFAWMLADSAAQGPQYGHKDSLCATIDVPGLAGWQLLQVFANWTIENYGPDFAPNCYYSTLCLSNPAYSAQWGDGTTWVWQCCSQVAYWQIAYPGSLRSQLLTKDYFVGQCQTAFGPAVFPDTVAFNARYGGATPRVNASSRVFATQGSDDPWLPAGVTAPLSFNYPEFTAVCDGCSHCKDLHGSSATDSPATTAQRGLVFEQLQQWLVTGTPNISNSSPPLSIGAVAGIVIGAFALVFIVLAAKYRVPQKVMARMMGQTEYAVLPAAATTTHQPPRVSLL